MQGYPGPRPPPKPGLSAGVIALLVVGGFVVLGSLGLVLLIVVYASMHAPPPGPADAGTVVVVEAPVASEPPAAPRPRPPPSVAPAPKGPRTVDFRCPAGSAPGGTVRAGCLCGDLILGTACGKGGFRDVTATATGCRFVCD